MIASSGRPKAAPTSLAGLTLPFLARALARFAAQRPEQRQRVLALSGDGIPTAARDGDERPRPDDALQRSHLGAALARDHVVGRFGVLVNALGLFLSDQDHHAACVAAAGEQRFAPRILGLALAFRDRRRR